LHFSDIHFVKKLGKGITATVYLAQYKETETVAVKLIRMEDQEKDLDSFMKELIIMSQLNHQNVVKFYGATLEPKMCFVIEFCPNGTLTEYMQLADTEVTWDLVVQWAYEIASGVAALHGFDPPVVHRDLKSMNILLTGDLVCKVGDFGLSRYTKPSLIKALQRQDTLANLRGTYMYTAPEIYHKKDYSPASDLYSLGMIIWEMALRVMTGAYVRPYSEFPQLQFDFQIIYASAVQNIRPTIPEEMPKELNQIISDCFKGEPTERPTCADIIRTFMKINRKSIKNLFGLVK
jgi:serine/threonine protein kinase